MRGKHECCQRDATRQRGRGQGEVCGHRVELPQRLFHHQSLPAAKGLEHALEAKLFGIVLVDRKQRSVAHPKQRGQDRGQCRGHAIPTTAAAAPEQPADDGDRNRYPGHARERHHARHEPQQQR